MSDTPIYGPQNWITTFSYPDVGHQSTAFGGADAPVSGYPEIASWEDVKVTAGAGPSGENVLDSTDGNYLDSGLQLCGLGALANGAFDVRGGFHAQTKQKLSSTAIVTQGATIAFRLYGAGTGAADDGLGVSDRFIEVGLINLAGWRWYVLYVTPSGISFTNVEIDAAGTQAIDNAFHTINLSLTPGTVTGAYAGGGFLGSAAVASDGALTLTVDGATVITASGLPLVINRRANATPNVYYGRCLGLGDGTINAGADIPGPVTGVYLYYAGTNTFTPPPNAPPCIPQASCEPPATTVLSSPSSTAGPNQGGIGWTPTYTGASGTVPVGADPVAGETLTGKSSVHVWTEITNTIYPAGTTTETLRYAMTDLDDATRKEGRLLSIGDVECSVSDAQGNLQAGTVDIQISDVNGRPIGTRLIDSTKKYIARNEISVFCLSDAGRRAGTRAKRIGRALLQDDTYRTPVVAKWSGVDPFFCDGGAFGPDKKFPMWTIPTSYINAPVDVYAKALPIIIGEVSDEGAIDPVTNLPNARGLCPLTFVGIDPLATGPGGAAENWGRFNVCLFASYSIVGLYGSDLSGNLYGIANAVSDGANPSVITLGGSPDLSTVVSRLAASAAAGTTDGTLVLTLFTGLHLGVVKAQITAADNTAKTVTISATVAVGDTVGFNTLAGPAAGVDWIIGEAPATRVKIDLATRNGQDCMVFGYPNYIRTTNYEDIAGSDGEVYRLTGVWVRGPLLEAHLNGQVTLAANVIGVEDKGDGTGLPLTDFFEAYNWFIENCLLVNSKIPKGPGSLFPQADGDLAAYADGTYMVKGSTFVAAQASSAVDVGGSGFKVGAYFGTQISTRDAIQLWNDNGGCRLGVNEDGQIFVWRLNRSDDTTTWPRVEHVNRVFGDVERTHPNTEIENVVQGTCDWDPDAQRYRNPLTVFTSTAGILHNKRIRKPSKLIDGKLTRDPQQWNYILQQRLAYAQDGPVYVTFTGDIGLLDYAIGSGIQFNSSMGPGAAGYVDQPLVILSKRFHVDSHLVTLTCLDVGSGSGMGLMIPVAQQFLITDNSGTAPTVSDTDAIAMVVAT